MNIHPALSYFLREDTPFSHGIPARKFDLVIRVAHQWLNLSRQLGPYKLTPLHVAVLTGDVKTVRALLETGRCDLNARDIRGWTPLHHAALISGAIVNALLKAGADSSLKNNKQGTPIDLCRMANAPEFAKNALIATPTGTITAEEFQELTGAAYIEDPYVPAADQIKLWKEGKPSDQLPADAKALEKFKARPPKIALTEPNPADETGKPLPIGRGVVALDDIEEGDYIGPYCGKFSEDAEEVEYLMSPWDGKKFRNLVPMVADGFPNCYAAGIASIGGVDRTMLVANERIPKGALLCYDYHTHPIKWGFVFGATTPKEHLKGRYLQSRPLSLQCFVDSPSLRSNAIRDVVRVGYLLDTPTALLSLVLSGKISLEMVERFRRSAIYHRTLLATCTGNFNLKGVGVVMQKSHTLAKALIQEALSQGATQVSLNLLRYFGENPDSLRGREIQKYSALVRVFSELLQENSIAANVFVQRLHGVIEHLPLGYDELKPLITKLIPQLEAL